MHRVVLDVAQRVVHPAHVPLEVEAEAAEVRRLRDAGPGGRFLGDRQHAREIAADRDVELAQELDRLEVLAPAVVVGNPLAGLAAVVEVQHRRHGVHAQAVDVVAVHPEQRVGDEEVAHLVPAVVEDLGAPVGVLALPRVGVLVQAVPSKLRRPCSSRGKCAGTQSMITPMPCLVAAIDEVHEVLRRAVARAWRVVADDLVAPGTVERVLGDAHQLEVRVALLASRRESARRRARAS